MFYMYYSTDVSSPFLQRNILYETLYMYFLSYLDICFPFMQSLGQTGVVQHVDSVGDARVLVRDRVWWFNSECLSTVTKESDDPSEETQPGV